MSGTHQHTYDPLLESLAIFAKRFHRPISIDALVSGLPIKPGASGPELFSIESSKGLFSRVAKRAGFATRLIRRDLGSLTYMLLPCILVLKDRNACVLESIDRNRNQAKVILPEIGEGEEWIDLEKLEEQYLGFAFLLKPDYHHERSAPDATVTREGHWFWGTLRRSVPIYGSVALASIMINLFVLSTPLFTMNVYDRVVPNNAAETLWVLAIGVGIIYFFDTFLRFMRNYLLEVAGKKADVIMSSIIFEQVMNLSMEKWPGSVGAFSNRLMQFESIRNFFTSSTLVAIVDVPFAVIFLIVISYIGGPLVSVPLFTIGLLLLYSLLLIKPLNESVQSVIAATAYKQSMLVENLHNIETIKTTGASRYAQWAWEESTGDIANRSLRTRNLTNSISVVTNLLVQFNMVGLVILGFYEITDLRLSLGGLIAVVILASRAIAPMAHVAVLITNFQQTRAAYLSLNELMALDVERPEGKQFVRRPEFEGAIEFKDVEFIYPESENAVLKDFSLKISPGEHVGIIGRVGSGKTTIAKLILQLYTPSSGALTIDGIDVNQIDPADLRASTAYLSQDIELLRGTIRENISLKDPQVDDETLLAAAKVAGVDLFINRLPRGYDTPLQEKGHGLSGGQQQCVALARTLLLSEPILILDEPTNSMDNTTESFVRKELYTHTRDHTLLLVTHKLPMLSLVERLVVIEDGRVLMDGPKEQVLKTLQGQEDDS